MISKDRKIWGFTDDYVRKPLPYPFEGITTKGMKINIKGVPTRVACTRGLLRAAILLSESNVDSASLPVSVSAFPSASIGIGMNTGKSGSEEIFAEFFNPDESQNVHLVHYKPESGELRAILYDSVTMQTATYTVTNAYSETDGTVIWLAVLPHLLSVSEDIADAYNKLLSYLLEDHNLPGATDAESAYEDFVLPFCYTVYNALVHEDAIKWKHETDTISILSYIDIQKQKTGPAVGKVMYGEFKVFKLLNGQSCEESFPAYDISKYSLAFTRESLSSEEQLMIPQIPDDNVTSRDVIDLLEEMTATWENPAATKITQVLLEGGAGSGKSYTARLIAAVLKRPFVTFTCSTNTDEVDIKGALLPIASEDDMVGLSDDEKEILETIYASDESEIYDNLAHIMNLPDTTECLFDPVGSFQQLAGILDEDCDVPKAYGALCAVVMAKVKQLLPLIKKTEGQVRYKYVPSSIVRAIQNGWILELQEPACMAQQGMLSCLFDILDKDSIGAMQTSTGTIYRHPDFMIVATTNRKYKGTKPLNEAARSRFQYFVKMETPSKEVIMQRVIRKVGITDSELAKAIVEVFLHLEERALEINATGAATMRGLYAFADAINRGKDINFALYHYLIWAISTDDEEIAELNQAVEDCELWKLR